MLWNEVGVCTETPCMHLSVTMSLEYKLQIRHVAQRLTEGLLGAGSAQGQRSHEGLPPDHQERSERGVINSHLRSLLHIC